MESVIKTLAKAVISILDIQMKALAGYSQQKQYNKTTSLLIAIQT
jgi:hypothetical protein